ncbi:MAG TPA: hypothetical protein VMV95_02440 [Bacillota bacterium]|nr:hypothetical protein [Bacillota bacterium]
MNKEPNIEQIHDACLSYRHDYGLMSKKEQEKLRFEALEWLKSWRKALSK